MSKDMAVIGFIGVVSAATTVVLLKWYRTRNWILSDESIYGAPAISPAPATVTEGAAESEPVAVVMG